MIELIKVNKCDEDAKLIMEWRNDINTLINSFRNIKYTWDEFINIFNNNYFNKIIHPLFATLNNEKIAFLGFNDTKDNDTIEISINMNPDFREKKLSVPIIQKTIEYIKNNYKKINKIRSLIK